MPAYPDAGVHGKINVFQFDRDTLERSGMQDGQMAATPPFLVVASNDINEDMNCLEAAVFWPERWVVCTSLLEPGCLDTS